ncbi:hypothetical protein [Phytomonospora endophytica]|uniref:SMI1/KNR4 family protein n=1 Tax=Phytomonospora endophytica TaxID=714109 RepID=A0A841FNU5_9ACTN|nr:hypothetical protein [Phytomonospora endophytica]MBB6034259.1 hypothetical protein [Phytomonospora endophytica]GIG66651.1 hypothetical protein Pen01_29460 [Phytomonospora endophytica]
MPYSPIPELNLLHDFAEAHPYFSEGFEFYDFDRPDAGLVEWFDMKGDEPGVGVFLDGLMPFAQATGGGSFYALWRCDDRADLATLPVVFFGDEGDLDVVGAGLRDLFRLLALDDEMLGAADGNDLSSDHHGDYVAWLAATFGLTPPADPDALIGMARAEHGEPFVEWLIATVPTRLDLTDFRHGLGR